MKYLVAGAPVYTLDERFGIVQAMVIEAGIIVAVGNLRRLRQEFPSARQVDISGGAVIPAFNDCHAHLLLLGQDLTRCDLGQCRTRGQVLRALQQWIGKNPSAPWVMGWNFDTARYEESLPLTCRDLDYAFDRQPVVISENTKHTLVANSAAMKLAEITGSTPNPPGGIIDRDAAGIPTGVFREMAAMELIESTLPDPGEAGVANMLRAAMTDLEQKGILAASEAFAGNWYPLESKVRAYNRVLEQGGPIRVTLMPEFLSAERVGWLEPGASLDIPLNPDLRLGPVKLMADGAISARTAALCKPYENSDKTGYLALSREEMERRLLRAQRAGVPTATHAIGDRAIEITLEVIEKVQSICPKEHLHHRIEHAILIDSQLCSRLAAAGIMVAAQPQLLLEMGDTHYAVLGERSLHEKPYRSLLKAGVRLGFGSDLPVVSGDPILGWRTAVDRKTRSGKQLGQDEGLSALEALRCYTCGSADVGGDLALGSLVPGKQARFAVLSHLPELILEEDIKVTGVSSRIIHDGVGLA